MHSERGALEEAQRCLERTLAIQETALGRDHPSLGATLTNLGAVHYKRGALEEAQRCHERALAIQETALGARHGSTQGSARWLRAVFQAQGGREGDIAMLDAKYGI